MFKVDEGPAGAGSQAGERDGWRFVLADRLEERAAAIVGEGVEPMVERTDLLMAARFVREAAFRHAAPPTESETNAAGATPASAPEGPREDEPDAFYCPNCNVAGVAADEDGLCVTCGVDAVPVVLAARLRRVPDEQGETRERWADVTLLQRKLRSTEAAMDAYASALLKLQTAIVEGGDGEKYGISAVPASPESETSPDE